MHNKNSPANTVESSPATLDKFQQAFQLHRQGQLAQAEILYREVLTEQPQHIDALHFSGVLANQLGQAQRAVELISLAIKIAPNNAAAHSNLGLALHALQRFDEALLSYDCALNIRPDNAEAYYNRANALLELKRFDEALASYERALVIKPDYAEAFINRGNALKALEHYELALASYEHALTINPNAVEAELGCSIILQNLKRFHAAITHYSRALTLKPDLEFIFGTLLHLKMSVCDWHDCDADLAQLVKGIEQGEKIAIPFSVLALSLSPALQKKAAEIYTATKYPNTLLLPPIAKQSHQKIKLGYFSSDFRNHPVSYLTAELFERHDRSRFEIIAFSFHATTQKDDMRLRLEATFDQFIDVSQYTDEQVVRLARQLEIDIAVDLNGCTEGCRTPIFAMRAAAIQVSYLGYPSTMGADYIDYLLADSVVIPTAYQCYYTEKIAYLPHSYWPNDSTLAIANKTYTRAELGLPEQGFVFCCFNNNYKITPLIFDSWMRLLHQVKDSVLWLLGSDVNAVENLRFEAKARGIATNRLVFAQYIALPEHLARQRVADLFLDTLPYNAHTTSTNALWAGLPVLTCIGEAFASRVAASLLTAIGLPELITNSLEDYEALAIQLATHPEQLSAIKQKLANHRLTYPLFDTKQLTQHIESLYQAMFDRYQAGLAPDHITVSAVGIAHPTTAQNLPSDNTDKFQQAVEYHQQGQLDQAETLYKQILPTQPQYADALHLLGVIAKQRGQNQLAIDLITQSLAINPDNAAAYSNIALAFQALTRFEEALANYDRALMIQPNYAEAFFNRGMTLQSLQRLDEAVASYDRALVLQPNHAETAFNRGVALQDLKRFELALTSYDRALSIKPDYAEAFYNRGNVLLALKQYENALASYERALAINPDLAFIFGAWLHLKMNLCDWRKFSHHLDELTQGIEQGKKIATPFAVQAISSSINLQKQAAKIYTQAKYPSALLSLPLVKHAHQKIKVAYFSSDFRNHPVAYLTAELFERHDRSQFEIIAFSFHAASYKDEMCLRLEAAFDQFIDVSQQSDEQVVQLARKLEIDIAVDLNGFTDGSRPNLFAMRVAPIQVSYLGYLGTMGADYIDYLLADTILIPVEHQIHYNEKIAYLPNSFQVNDSKLAIADKVFTRAELDLPEQEFVFCCFNANFKIIPAVFAAWMRILRQVEGSVLWLFAENALAEKNLRLEASTRGINAERLIFAQRQAMPEYLAAQRVADLFLDTSPYNAGATASAALWAGLPVLTYLGDTFSGRMAASLLNAIGLSELITNSLEDYEALAIQLATHPEQLAIIKQKLANNRLTYPLFDTALFTQHIESVYQTMFDRYQADLAPDHITVSVLGNAHPTTVSVPAEIPTHSEKFQQAFNLHRQGQLEQAEFLYQEALKEQAQHIDALHFSGVLADQRGQSQRAVELISLAVKLAPNYSAAHSNLGLALHELRRFDEALSSYDRALAIKPDNADALFNRGHTLRELKRFELAISSYEQALAIKPDLDFIFGTWLYLKMNICAWDNLDQHLNQLAQGIERGEKAVIPFSVLAMYSSAALQKKAAEIYSATKYPNVLLLPPIAKYQHQKIRIGYFSSDFRQHPVAHLTVELFERHDRSRFEIIAFSFYAASSKDDMRLRLEAAFDQFIDVSQQSDEQVVQLARALEIDIAIDLNGCTSGCRTHIFALRAAPIQVNYLGYPGTMGATYMDYLIASPTLIPPAHQPYYTEKIAYLPHLYMVNTNSTIADRKFTRAELNLPEQGFVFCCFNNNYKITPVVFASWMRILHYVENSVLWLLEDNEAVAKNLRREAIAHSIAAERLIFAQRVPMPEYLARHQVADLFLDTLPYNAHTTASSALWSGLPVLTCLGETFAGRAAAGFLNAIGLPELITTTLADYEALAIQLATHPEQLSAHKQKLADNRLSYPLFSAALFTQHIESVYQAMFERYQADLAPDHIDVSDRVGNAHLTTVSAPTEVPVHSEEFQQAFNLHQQGQLLEAKALYEQLLQSDPQNADVLHFLGVLKNQTGQAQQAVALIRQSLQIYPNNIAAYSNLGFILQALNRLDEAVACYDTALTIQPDVAELHLHRANLLLTLQRFEQALASYDQALAIQADMGEALCNRGLALQNLKRLEEALANYDHALTINPDHVEVLANRGSLLLKLRRFDEGLASYNRALAIMPDDSETLINRGNLLQELKRLDEAVSDYDHVLVRIPDHVEALYHRGAALQNLKRWNEALASYEQALTINPDREFLLGTWLLLKMKLCDWQDFDYHLNQLKQKITQGKKATDPFSVLAISTSASLQKQAAEIYIAAKYPSHFLLPLLVKHRHQKIKLGYFSSDFRHHPVAYLTAELFECHDPLKFEIIAFSLYPSGQKDDMTLRLEAAFDQFIDVSQQSDEQIVQLARQLEIDIAIDLNGFTEGCRPNLFAMRVAPIQVSYLGYLGTMGADYMDYVLADATLIPVEHQANYREKIACLPNSFQVNDSKLAIADKIFTRAELGLPEQGFVFCCFNNNYKITPTVFDSWMRILHQVEGSVLWLLKDNDTVAKNLRLEAVASGIDAERLIFAQRRAMPEYLAAQRVADLFLDTSPYNAGATASAALWTGLPVLTYLGDTFSGRMAASLLHAIGLPELITNSLEDYETLAIQLATHREQLAVIKQKLANNRLTYPLFDTALFTQHIESVYQIMFDRYQAGLAPDHITVVVSDNVSQHTSPAKPSKQGLFGKIIKAFKTRKNTTTPADNEVFDQFEQAQRLHRQGQLVAAELLYEAFLKTQPQHSEALRCLNALKKQLAPTKTTSPNISHKKVHVRLGKMPDLSHQAPVVDSKQIEDLINQGNELEDQDRLVEALASYEQALVLNPNYARAYSNRGNVLQSLKRFDEALESYDKALAIKPDYAEAFYNRGNALQMLKRVQEAIASYNRALTLKPDFIQALIGLGNAHYDSKQFSDALINYERALVIHPNHAEALFNCGNTQRNLDRFDDALASYDRALVINPNYAEAFFNRSQVLKDLKRWDEALIDAQQGLAIKPDDLKTHSHLINLLKEQGRIAEAKASLNTALAILPDSVELQLLQLMMTLPIVLSKPTDSNLVLEQFDQAMTELATWLTASPAHQASLTKLNLLPLPFSLAYRTGNHVQRLSRYGDLIANTKSITSPTLRNPSTEKIRLVVISHHFRRHSVWDVITKGLITHLDRSRFELILYYLDKIEDQETAVAKSLADQWRDTQSLTELSDYLAALEKDAPEVIFYPEIGMGLMAAKLASYRLAPLQIVSWGHPITTGLATIDYYISGELLESPDADSHYRERLIRLPSTGCCSTAIDIAPQPLAPELVAQILAKQGIRFLSAQTVYKFDPADDVLYAQIARVVPDSIFIFLRETKYGWAMDQIIARLKQTFRDYGLNPEQHLLVIPWQTMEKFQSLLDVCDVYLDCPSFSGYTTAMQAVQHGLPIVTLEGELMRQRLAAGLLRKIGLTDTIASCHEDYVQCAARLAEECRDPIRRTARRDALRAAASKANNDVNVIKAFEQQIVEALAKTNRFDVSVNHKTSEVLNQNNESDTAETLVNQGNDLEDLNRLEEALACYDRALFIDPNYARAYSNRGNVLQSLNRFEEALESYDKALLIRPDYAEAFYNRGNTLQACNRLEEAIASYDRALTIKPDFIQALVSRGNALHDSNHPTEALSSYDRALAIYPDYAEAFYNRGNVLLDLKHYQAAIDSYNRAVAIKPDYAEAHWNSGLYYLLLGDFDTGWKKYEWRWKTGDSKNTVRHFSQPQWFGEGSLQGKTIFLYSEQGLGDTLHFCRYAKQVANLGARVILEVQKPLLRLLANLEGVDQIIAQGSVLPAFDFHSPLLSLPLAFKTRLDSIPVNSPYLFSEPDKVKHWQTRLGKKTLPRVGVVWSGNPAQKDDHRRSLTLHELLPLFTPHYQFISLQKELRDTDRDVFMQQSILQHYGEQLNDFTDTAALIELMDVVISVCTSVGHLAAAMGKPTWILLSDHACWRWLLNREDSPWYPTIRLFRQSERGDWQGVIERVQHELIHLPAPIDKLDADPITPIQNTPSPDNADKFQNALSMHQQGRMLEAEALYQDILQTEPQHVDALHFLGVLKHQNGQDQLAVELITQSLKVYPDNAAAYANLGMVLQSLNRLDDALLNYDKVLTLKPNDIAALLARSHLLLTLNRHEQALLSYDEVLTLQPNLIEALLKRGTVLQLLNRFEEALINYDRLLAIDAHHAEALFGRANVLYNLKRPHEAADSYQQSLAINPDSFEAFYNQGVVLESLNRVDEAMTSYQRALAIKPDYAEVHNSLGAMYRKQTRYTEAEDSYQRAIAIKPDYIDAHCNLITLIKDRGRLLEAETSLNTALMAIPDSIELRFIKLIMTLPVVLNTVAESALVPSRFNDALTDLSNWLADSPSHQQSLTKAGLLPLPFLLAYRAGNHIQLLSRYGDLVANHSACEISAKPLTEKIRMVVVSHHFRRHSVWDVVTRGLLVNLDRSRFELILYHLGNIEDQETALAKSLADQWRDTYTMPHLSDWLTALNNDAPDVIFYPEIGMDPMSAKLASHRFAALQITSWGHPITTGLPYIDLYFSGALLESSEADSHYREKLIRLPGTGCCTTPINIMPEPNLELETELAKRQGICFVIAQTTYKFDPADDALYADIASVVGECTFMLLRDSEFSWATDQILARLEQTFIERGLNPTQYLFVLPWQTMEKFQTLLDLCDVYLDCPSFSGYTTALQAVRRGIPIVTLEGEFMRQRLAAGLLRKIGITDTIAHSREEYIQCASMLAQECRNPLHRAARRNALKTAAPKADNDVSVVRAFEQSVIDALAERNA